MSAAVTQMTMIQELVDRRLKVWAAKQTEHVLYSQGRTYSTETDGVTIGSKTPVDISYAIEGTTVTYTY